MVLTTAFGECTAKDVVSRDVVVYPRSCTVTKSHRCGSGVTRQLRWKRTMALFGQPNVEKLETKRDLAGLAKALSNSDASIRRAAASALERLDEATAVPLIVDQLKSVADKVSVGKADPSTYDEGVGVLRAMGARGVQHLVASLRILPTTTWSTRCCSGSSESRWGWSRYWRPRGMAARVCAARRSWDSG
jgi:hypothetical protein